MFPNSDGANINGPSLIRTPEWLTNPLGTYYLYFAHHRGTYIRLATADTLDGPWTIQGPGTLHGAQLGDMHHIASPDVHVLQDETFRMYFHGRPANSRVQHTYVAHSADGINFTPTKEALLPGHPYFRALPLRDGTWMGLSVCEGHAQLWTSPDGLAWTKKEASLDFSEGTETYIRHVALRESGAGLKIYYTRIGDSPERLRRCDLIGTSIQSHIEIARPETREEGALIPIRPSKKGPSKRPEHALRDPAWFIDRDGQNYLLYSVRGEHGIAIGRLLD